MRTQIYRPMLFLLHVVVAFAFDGATRAFAAPVLEETPPVFIVQLTSGDSIAVVALRPSWTDFVRVIRPDGTDEFFPRYRIERVRDEAGTDRTRDIVERRRNLGTIPVVSEPLPPPRPPRYGPRSVTKSFGISDTGPLMRVGGPDDQERSFGYMFELGRAYNVGTRVAVGATLFLGGGDEYAEAGVRARMRYWLGTHSAIDFAPGLIMGHEEPGRARGDGVGWIGEVAWTPARLVSLGVQGFSVKRTDVHVHTYYADYDAPGGRDTGIRLSFKVGGTPGLVTGLFTTALGLFGAWIDSAGSYGEY